MKKIILLPIFLTLFITAGFTIDEFTVLKEKLEKKYSSLKPKLFSQIQPGVKYRIVTDEKIIALTFDACGHTEKGSKLNKGLIDFLLQEKIPATLFISGKWIDKNQKTFVELSKIKQFEIENHGLRHIPATVSGKKGYGIAGPKNVSQLVDEIELNAKKIEKLTNRRPKFYRPGTAYFDDVAIKVSYDLGYIPMNFNLNPGDADKKLSADLLSSRLINKVKNGSIVIMHMNHTDGKTLAALKKAVPAWKKMGYNFVKLEEYQHKLNK